MPVKEQFVLIRIADIRPRNVQMFFPEANPVIRAGRRDPVALVPDYNAVVEVVPVPAEAAAGDGGSPDGPGAGRAATR